MGSPRAFRRNLEVHNPSENLDLTAMRDTNAEVAAFILHCNELHLEEYGR
jgi:hypothetical protein